MLKNMSPLLGFGIIIMLIYIIALRSATPMPTLLSILIPVAGVALIVVGGYQTAAPPKGPGDDPPA